MAQKESIKGLKSKVDVLTMSATPIPRTMHMAVAGFRDTSLITTPPPERRPIKTHVSVSNKDLIKEVVEVRAGRWLWWMGALMLRPGGAQTSPLHSGFILL